MAEDLGLNADMDSNELCITSTLVLTMANGTTLIQCAAQLAIHKVLAQWLCEGLSAQFCEAQCASICAASIVLDIVMACDVDVSQKAGKANCTTENTVMISQQSDARYLFMGSVYRLISHK